MTASCLKVYNLYQLEQLCNETVIALVLSHIFTTAFRKGSYCMVPEKPSNVCTLMASCL